MAWEAFKSAVKDVRNIELPKDDAVKRRAFQFEIYQKYHRAYWRLLKKFNPEKIRGQRYMKDMANI